MEPSAAAPSQPATALSAVERAVLLTVTYSDLFDYPLTPSELYRYLVAPGATKTAFESALQSLLGRHLSRTGQFVTLAGRESVVTLRMQREHGSDHRWASAERYAHWLRWVPFVRMVAVCGSVAAGNARPDADIDIFIVTDGGRLWTVQVCAMMLRRAASVRSVRVCANYFLTIDSLEVEPQSLYTAREIAQSVPLRGEAAYRRFLAANRWVAHLLPNVAHETDRCRRLVDETRPRLTRSVEALLRGGLGDVLDRALHRLLLLYYPLRLLSRGFGRRHVARAYRPDRQVVIGGGYGPAVARAFRERATSLLGDALEPADLAVLFPPCEPETATGPDRFFTRLFAERYGHGHD